ncbi:MFS general substrate transporter [Schizophyllum commune H4-8]|uniref:MFS general substrate transporter n=1 Tax=Schizophyllum commune (strain H4-8 / FGSC 9210) TaxID=578458 RepID=UPI00216053EE|nr:MFS general substrate transporter [Schizophyllum commune H4-8]KAI5886685.1 MFS general substrate transporter [Schizophyllum commune H4-8]
MIKPEGKAEAIELTIRVPQTPFSPAVGTVSVPGGDTDLGRMSRTTTTASQVSVVSELPPVDRGFGAWSFLAAAFMVETIVWGFPTAYGTLLEAYLADPQYNSQPGATSQLALIGPLISGVMHCSSPLINPMLYRYPRCGRPLCWAGMALCAVSLFASSYAKTVPQLLALQGVIYSIGGSLFYAPIIFYMSQWFLDRRGIANGVIFAGTSVGGVALPLAFPPLIARFGIPTSLRIFAGLTLAILLPFLPFVKGRLPETHTQVRGPEPRNRKEWWKEASFLLLLATNMLHAFGYFVPTLWLPTFASALDLSASKSSLTLALLNGAATFGRLATGLLSDRFEPWGIAVGMLALTAAASFIFWGVLSHTFPGLIMFSVLFGIISSGWTTLWTGFVRPIAKDDPNLATTLFGWLLLTRGVANVLSTPISTALETPGTTSSSGNTITLGFQVAGGRFEKMIVFTGACFVGAVVVVSLGWGLEVRKRLRGTGSGMEF